MSPDASGDDTVSAGWKVPVGTDQNGDIALSYGTASIEESISVILGTAKGERVMRPEFGCEIHDHVFDTINQATISLVESAVEEALLEWEPRIDIEQVDARPNPEQPSQLQIDIQYVERETNTSGSLVYPFYVGSE